jgi:predicted phage-related endonuclease
MKIANIATTNMINFLKELKMEAKALEAAIKAKEAELKQSFLENNTSAFANADNVLIASWYTKTQLRLDTDRLKAENPELYESYLKEVSFKTLLIK